MSTRLRTVVKHGRLYVIFIDTGTGLLRVTTQTGIVGQQVSELGK